MTSKDDEKLPLPGFSQELSVDTTVDDDFIPTSQPHSPGSSKMSRNSETSYNKSTEESTDSKIDDTLPPDAVLNLSTIDRDKSADFIPDTETKKPKISHENEFRSCVKRIPVFRTDDIFKQESNPLWDMENWKVPESPGLDSPALEREIISVLNDTPTKTVPSIIQETVERGEESVTEIAVNDSAETVDLEVTPVTIKTSQGEKAVEKLEVSSFSNGETFDNSSVLVLDQLETVRLDLHTTEAVSESLEESGRQDPVKDSETPEDLKTNDVESKDRPVGGVSGKCNMPEKVVEGGALFAPKEEVQPISSCTEPNGASIVTRKIEFQLNVSCLITVNTKTNQILQKIISDVKETPKPKPTHVCVEPFSDNTSEKSKRQSSSSSGSTYSDKFGPFALPKRVSAISDQTDSSEEEFGTIFTKRRRARERVPWSNEYLLPLKMDDIMLANMENQEFLKRLNTLSSPKKFKNILCKGVNQLKNILESSSSEITSTLVSGESESFRTSPTGQKTLEGLESTPLEDKEEEKPEEDAGKENCANDGRLIRETEPSSKQEETGNSSVGLCEGLAVFARWTDKRYYSGVLCESSKNDRWVVKFDDGTLKTTRGDFIMPAEWLKVGSLAFASTGDKYESGKIVDMESGEYVVELDFEKRKVSVKISDLYLSEVMAGIVREKYKPFSGTPRRKADIDFDNVVSGKRLREQRTPLRSTVGASAGSSGAKKASSLKSNKNSLQSIKENSENDTRKKMTGLKSENGHLVEDKVISADSPSGTEATETPLREGRRNAKPRSLSYEAEETQSWKKSTKRWLKADGTPIPGPSGVNFKKQRTKRKETEHPVGKSDRSPPRGTENSGRKRKLDEFEEGRLRKKPLVEEDSGMKTRNKKGGPIGRCR